MKPKEIIELKEMALELNKLLKKMDSDYDRIRVVNDLVLDGICPLCGDLYLPCYCHPKYDI